MDRPELETDLKIASAASLGPDRLDAIALELGGLADLLRDTYFR